MEDDLRPLTLVQGRGRDRGVASEFLEVDLQAVPAICVWAQNSGGVAGRGTRGSDC